MDEKRPFQDDRLNVLYRIGLKAFTMVRERLGEKADELKEKIREALDPNTRFYREVTNKFTEYKRTGLKNKEALEMTLKHAELVIKNLIEEKKRCL